MQVALLISTLQVVWSSPARKANDAYTPIAMTKLLLPGNRISPSHARRCSVSSRSAKDGQAVGSSVDLEQLGSMEVWNPAFLEGQSELCLH